MPIMIERIESYPDDLALYQIRVNREVKAVFAHRSTNGIAECLRAAAATLEKTNASQ